MVSSSQEWRARWIGWRNRVLSDPGFQRWAARFPLARPVARGRARALFDLVAGFTYSQIVLAAVESGLLERLAGGPAASDAIAAGLDLPEDAAVRLLRAAAALDLVEPLGQGWALGATGAALRGNGGLAEMVRHHRLLYADLADPLALLRRGGGGGALAGFWRYGAANEEVAPGYSALMAASQAMIADQVLDAVRFEPGVPVLDIGGGEGAFARALRERAPAVPVTVFDLPAVAARAQANGVPAIGGNFARDSLPTGFGVVTLVRVLHDHDDAVVEALLAKIAAALPPGGRLVIAEPMGGTRGAEAMGDAYFGLYLLAMGSGRPRRFAELRAVAERAGFRTIAERRTALPLLCRVLIART